MKKSRKAIASLMVSCMMLVTLFVPVFAADTAVVVPEEEIASVTDSAAAIVSDADDTVEVANNDAVGLSEEGGGPEIMGEVPESHDIPEVIDPDSIVLEEGVGFSNFPQLLGRSQVIKSGNPWTHTGSLTSSNPNDILIFEVPSTNILTFNFQSTANYTANLAFVDWSTMLIQRSNVYVSPNAGIRSVTVGAGSWAWIIEGSTSGAPYTFTQRSFASLPSSILYITSDLLNVYYLSGGELYNNNDRISTSYAHRYSNQYETERVDLTETLYYGGMYGDVVMKRTQAIGSPIITRYNDVLILAVIDAKLESYSTALPFPYSYCDPLFMKMTPRYLDSQDLSIDNFIIYDVKTKKVIDYISRLNWEWWRHNTTTITLEQKSW